MSVSANARGALPLGPLELVTGLAFGHERDGPAIEPGGVSARAVLEQSVLTALARPPCFVSLSGGRASSGILALAVSVARREGLPEPVPLSLQFPTVPAADESGWQELVVRRLGLQQWERRRFGEELEVLGDIATAALSVHGLLWPPSSQIYVPVLDAARGGSLLTTLDAGMLLDGWRAARAQAVLHGRVRPEPRDLLRIALAFAPAGVRVRRVERATRSHMPWVRPAALDPVVRTFVSSGRAREPRRWDRRVARFDGLRYHRVAAHSIDVLGAARDVEVHHPLRESRFLASLAGEGGAAGLRDGWQRLFGDLLPDAVLTRHPTRAELGPVLWGERSRAFADVWDGAGLDLELVDRDRLRAAWRGPHPWMGASTLAQAAWLASSRVRAGAVR